MLAPIQMAPSSLSQLSQLAGIWHWHTTHDILSSLCTKAYLWNYRLDGKHVVFGKVVSGMDVIYKVEAEGRQNGTPKTKVVVADSGELPLWFKFPSIYPSSASCLFYINFLLFICVFDWNRSNISFSRALLFEFLSRNLHNVVSYEYDQNIRLSYMLIYYILLWFSLYIQISNALWIYDLHHKQSNPDPQLIWVISHAYHMIFVFLYIGRLIQLFIIIFKIVSHSHYDLLMIYYVILVYHSKVDIFICRKILQL